MNEMYFLEEAVLNQMVRLLKALEADDLPFPLFCKADDELSKLYDFAVKNHFFIPNDLHIEIICRNL